MRIANIDGRAHLVTDGLALDVAEASDGRFGPRPEAVYDDWAEFSSWAAGRSGGRPFATAELGTPVPRPAQIFAVGLNYADHAAESGLALPENPLVFTKFASSLTGPDADVRLTGDTVDWEAELVVVIGVGGRDIPATDGWSHVAGLTVGQDLSDRTVQWWGTPAQFNLGKSQAGFAPVGPYVVTLEEITGDRDALAIGCTVLDPDGTERVLQKGTTADLIFSVPDLIARLSAIVELLPGDLIFTGTPAGVGMGRKPAEFLRDGQTLTTTIEGVGSIVQRFWQEPVADGVSS